MMEEILRRILESAVTGFAGDQVMKRTGLGDRAEGILDKLIPPAAASDSSSIPPPPNYPAGVSNVPSLPEDKLIPADQVMTPDQEQMVMSRIATEAPDRPRVSGRTYLPDMMMQEPTDPAMVDVTNEARKNEVQDFVRMVGGRTQNLMQEVPEGNPQEAAALATTEAMASKGMSEEDDGGFFDNVGGFLTDLFGDEERMTRMALAFNSMRLQPDQGLASALSKRLDKLGDLRLANRTAAALRAKGTPAAIAAADYIEQTGDAKGGMKMAMEADQYVTGSGKEIEEKFGIKGLIPNKPYRYNKLTKKVEGVGGGDTIFEATKPSKGMQFVRDDSGKILYEEPIPRKLSPEAAKTKATSNVLVMDEMDRLLNLIEDSPGMTTGFGTFLSGIPTTDARNAQRLADTIKGNIGFDRLQRMREESPTGGALGQVAVQELQALQSTMGSFDLGQDAETVKYNLNRLKQQYARTMLALADAQPNFEQYFPDFNRAAYEEIVSRPTGQGAQPKAATKPQITPEQARAELARRRGQ
jgi:hypothetical protein